MQPLPKLLEPRPVDVGAEHLAAEGREGISRNQAAVRLLRKGARLEEPEQARNAIGNSLDWFIGSWTDEQARELERAIAGFEMADEDLWR
jgi:hypothetical protein